MVTFSSYLCEPSIFFESHPKIDSNFFTRENAPFCFFFNFSNALTMLHCLVSFSIQKNWGSQNVCRRSTYAMMNMHRLWSKLWKNKVPLKKCKSDEKLLTLYRNHYFLFKKFRTFNRTFKEIEDMLRKKWIRLLLDLIWMPFFEALWSHRQRSNITILHNSWSSSRRLRYFLLLLLILTCFYIADKALIKVSLILNWYELIFNRYINSLYINDITNWD